MGHKAVGHDGQATPLWQRRYYDRNVRDNEEFIQELKYIHRNPVKRGLVEKPGDWQWSSYRHYALDEKGIVAVESPWAGGWPIPPSFGGVGIFSGPAGWCPELVEGSAFLWPNVGTSPTTLLPDTSRRSHWPTFNLRFTCFCICAT